MNTYTPDLELRRRVAEYFYHCSIKLIGLRFVREREDMGGDKGWYEFEPLPFDISFDAILPLIFALPEKELDVAHKYLYYSEKIDEALTLSWNMMCGNITPTDYCHAYLAAIKSQTTPAQQEK